MPVRERIGRFKYTPEAELEGVYKDINDELTAQVDKIIKEKEDF
jgi:V/A-type H+-transporting ATPase subunit A